MSHKIIFLLLLLLFLAMSGAQAQQAPAPDPANDIELSEEERKKAEDEDAIEKGKQQPDSQTAKNEDASKTTPPKKVFKPTEEISEDSPVPFPVDI